MSASGKPNRKRLAAVLEQAALLASQGKSERVVQLLTPVVSLVDSAPAFALLGAAHLERGEVSEAIAVLERGLARCGSDAALHGRLGDALQRREEHATALAHFEMARRQLANDHEFLSRYALALAEVGRLDEAQALVYSALAKGAGPKGKLVQALVFARRGQYAAAERLARDVEESQPLAGSAAALRADCKLFLGEAKGALDIWKAQRAAGRLNASQVGHMAYAAQLAGDVALCDELFAERLAAGGSAEDLLLFAQIATLRGQPERALDWLDKSEGASGERNAGWEFEMLATRGRAQRLLGRREPALNALEAASAMPEFVVARLGPKVGVDLGHLAAEAGDFEQADEHFRKALAIDPGEPEAKRGLELTQRRLTWRAEVDASARAQVEAAQAEAEAMRRRFVRRDGELAALRRELEAVKAARREADERAKVAQDEVQHVEADRARHLREELAERERDSDAKAMENMERALGEASPRCPPEVKKLLMVAEKTFQRALHTELPAAAVAVLFSGALERALFCLFVERFSEWLGRQGRREAFLKGAVRERRGNRIEYFDHFVEAFDEERAGRAPSLGEVGRALERRNESYLAPFAEFLAQSYAVPDAFYGELASFVAWAKEKLRDPVAHGRGIELKYDELRALREQLLFSFGAHGRGLLALLLSRR